jgi:hypothetical protein
MPGIAHNLGIYGWDLRDVLERTADTAREEERVPEGWHLVPLVRNATRSRPAAVLESARAADGTALTPLGAARALGEQGTLETGTGDGIETLIVAIGSNNALGSVIGLCVRWSGDGFDDLRRKGRYNVWRPEHFASELDLVAAQLRDDGGPPRDPADGAARDDRPRGAGRRRQGGARLALLPRLHPTVDRRPRLRPAQRPHLTSDEARRDRLRDRPVQRRDRRPGPPRAREQGRDWRLLDLAGLLDRLATAAIWPTPPSISRTGGRPTCSRTSCSPCPPAGHAIHGVGPVRAHRGRPLLAGRHPPDDGRLRPHGQELIRVMREAGVVFFHPDGVTPRPDPVQLDWRARPGRDSLLAHPLASLTGDVALLGWLDQRLDILGRLWAGLTGG